MQTATALDDIRTEAPCFRILGLLEVRGTEPVLITARRQQVVLSLLLLNANRVVRVESLLDALWGCDPPVTARAQVQTCVSALRRSLAQAGLGERIRARGAGYALDVEPTDLDLHVFDGLVLRARAALAADRPDSARAAYREALTLWRGEPLTGIESGVVRANRVRIAERLVEVFEDCVDVELRLGLHRQVVGEISAMVAEHPLRERLAGQLMIALYRCGRRPDALSAYRELRQTLVDELGLEPGPQLRQLHQDILTDTLAADAEPGHSEPPPGRLGATLPVPRMLPARVPYFTGQEALLGTLRRQLVDDSGPLVAVIAGRGGVGKSAVAVEAAHRLADAFPDGQLYARLTDADGRAEDLAAVLERFLRALGYAEIPADLEGRTALYRSAIAGRRLLTVLEDVVDEAQFQPLVPGTAACRLIVTTRARAAALPGTTVFELDVLDVHDGIELLVAMVGRERVFAELWEATELVERCGGLQVALCGAASRLAARPHWTFGYVVARLRTEGSLEQLSHLGIDVRATLRRSYVGLPGPARRLFARLGLLESGPCAAWLAAPLLDLDTDAAADALELLVDARLVDVACGTGTDCRYRLHELTRLYARELAGTGESARERAAALDRVFGAWLCLADEARRRSGDNRPDTYGDAPRWPLAAPVLDAALVDPAGWYEREAPALLATVRHAARVDAVDHCWQLAIAIAELAGARRRFTEWRDSNETALRAALRAGNRLAEARLQHSLGEVDLREQRYSDAAARINLAVGMFDELGQAGWRDRARRAQAVVERARAEAPRRWADYTPPVHSGQLARPAARRREYELASSYPGRRRAELD